MVLIWTGTIIYFQSKTSKYKIVDNYSCYKIKELRSIIKQYLMTAVSCFIDLILIASTYQSVPIYLYYHPSAEELAMLILSSFDSVHISINK